MVRAGVDHEGPRREQLEFSGDGTTGTVRQGQEDDVMAGQHLSRGLLQDAIGQGMQMRLEGTQTLPGVRVGRDGPDLHFRVGEEEAQDFSSGISAGAGDGNCETHAPMLGEICSVANIYAELGCRTRITAP
ncbi:hypothetical protein GCM10009791_16930 [Citricoccus zhacaiensis]